MDETVELVRVPPQMSTYADNHHLFHLMEYLVCSLIVHRPDDPISWLISFLQRRSVDVPRILLLGPPAVGKRTLAMQLSAELRAVHVTTENLLKDQSELSSESEQEFPAEPLVKLIQQRLSDTDCFHQGWVLEGVPQTRLQALNLQQAGVFPEHVVLLEAPDDVLMDRSQGRLVDPLTGDVYHHTFIMPSDPDVAQRLEKWQSLSGEQLLAHLHRYRREVAGLSSAYKYVLKVFNSDQPQADVHQQVLSFVRTRQRSRTPRILLLGPPGSGRSHLAKQLSEKYKMVNVCCGRLLRSAAAQSSAVGDQVRPYVDEGQPVPDTLVLKVLQDRLSRVDCSCRGWILHGFPSDLQQARVLQETQHQPNRVFFLELADDVCLDRLTLRGTDPVTGHRFHTVTRPAPNNDVFERLQTRPADRKEAVTLRLDHYRTHNPGLKVVFPDAVHIDADQDPHSVFEAVESRLTTD